MKYDFIFFGFWLSHVPEDRFDSFWRFLAECLVPEGAVFFVDSLATPLSTARDHAVLENSGIARRKLNDGSEYDIVKILYDPTALQKRLQDLGWNTCVRSTGEFFFHGHATR